MELQRQAKRNTVVIEKGYIRRDIYYAVGLNGLNGRAFFNNEKCSAARFNQLGVQVKPWRKNGDHIVVAGQVPSDASVQHIDILQWAQDVVYQLKDLTDRQIYYRPHPLAVSRSRSVNGATFSLRTLEEDLENAWAVVTFNSNTAVDAALAGIPVFVFDVGSMAWGVANKDLKLIENPEMPSREQWLNDLAYCQWTLKEMEAGLPWSHIKEAII